MTPDPDQTDQARAVAEAARLLRRADRPTAKGRVFRGRVFREGQRVADRYKIVGFLERGGVGQVYRAEDQELGIEVALKTLHPGLAASERTLSRFRREILLARAVTHEHVCRIFELGRHIDGNGKPVLFVTMELIQGETLADHVERLPPLDLEEVVELATQIAQGLAAAHRKGVIHRDIKAQNILIEETSEGPRAVLSDFGLAISETALGSLEPADAPCALEGTPLTMAPEQVGGETIEAAADIYSFGVLLFYLSTSQWPFEAQTPLATALLRLDRDPMAPSRVRSEIPPALEQLILACLEKRPEDRPESMEQVLHALHGLGETLHGPARGGPTQESPATRRSLPSWSVAGLSLILVVLLAYGVVRNRPEQKRVDEAVAQDAAPTGNDRLSGLWLGISTAQPDADSADSRWLKSLVEQSLGSALEATDRIRWVTGERARQILRELDALPPGPLPRSRVEALARRAGVDRILSGWAVADPDGQRLRLELHLQSSEGAEASEPSEMLTATVSTRDLAGLGLSVAGLAKAVRARLEVPEPTPEQAATLRAELPTDSEAARLFGQALDALHRFETQKAVEVLQQSLEIEPDHPVVLSALASAWQHLGHSQKGRDTARRAFEHAGGLSRARQMRIEARYRLQSREWKRAESLFQALWEFFPDELGYGLGLLEAQDRAGALDAAHSTLEALKSRTPAHEDPRIHLAESLLAYHQGDYDRSQSAARQAQDLGEALNAPSLVAEAIIQEALTRLSTDADLGPVEAMLTRARDLLQALGEQRGRVRVELYLGDCAQRRDHFDAAESYYRGALEQAAAIGSNSNLDRARTSLAILYDRKGQLRRGLVLKEQVLLSYDERNVVQGAAITQENIAISLLKMGRPAEALRQLAEVQERYRNLGDQIGLAWSPYYQGRAWLDRGELKLADRELATAKSAANPKDGEQAEGLNAAVDYERARLAFNRGDPATARELLQPLVGFYESQGRPSDVAEIRWLLARIARRDSRLQEAERFARGALDHFDSAGIQHLALATRAVLASLEMDRFRLGEPGELPTAPEFETCRELIAAKPIEHRRLALLAAVPAVRCAREMALADDSRNLSRLDAVIREARELELFLPELEARRLRAEIWTSGGRTADARKDLEMLQGQATERGFQLSALWSAPEQTR